MRKQQQWPTAAAYGGGSSGRMPAAAVSNSRCLCRQQQQQQHYLACCWRPSQPVGFQPGWRDDCRRFVSVQQLTGFVGKCQCSCRCHCRVPQLAAAPLIMWLTACGRLVAAAGSRHRRQGCRRHHCSFGQQEQRHRRCACSMVCKCGGILCPSFLCLCLCPGLTPGLMQAVV